MFGLVSIRQATSPSAFARRSATSTPPCVVGGDLDDLEARHRDRRRVGAVGGVGREHLVAALAAILVVGARQEHARELAVGSRRGLQAHVREARDLGERPLQVPHQLERALRALGVLQRVQPRMAGERRRALVQARVVLHRARAERVEARVEIEVALGQAHVVAHDLRLGDLGQRGGSLRRSRSGSASGPAAGTSSSGQTNARRPRAPFWKIVRAGSRCSGVAAGVEGGGGALTPAPPPRRGRARRRRPRRAPPRACRCRRASAAR